MLAAKSYQLPSNDPGAAFGQIFATTLADTVSKMADAAATATWDKNRAKAIVENARVIVDGRTAKEVISIASTERKSAVELAISIYQDQLGKAKAALNDIQAEVDATTRQQGEQKVLLDKVTIMHPKFYFQTNGFINAPVVSFTISNNGDVPVKRIFVEGTLQTPGRSVPWVKDSFNYDLQGGLEPGETQSLHLAPNMFSEWGNVPKDAVDGAVLSLTMTAFEDASGKRFGQDTEESDRIEGRKKAFEDAIQELNGRISDLQKLLQ